MDNLPGNNQRQLKSKVLPINQIFQSRLEESRAVPKKNSNEFKTHPNTSDGRRDYQKIQSMDYHTKKFLLKERGNFIMRQELKSYTPECSALCGIISNLIIALACIVVGVPSVYYADRVVEYSVEYTKWFLLNYYYNIAYLVTKIGYTLIMLNAKRL